MPKTSERRKNCELQIPSPNPTTNTSGWETLGKLTNIWKTDPKDAFPGLLEVWRESDAIMHWKPLLSVWRVGASVMRHKRCAAALILLWPLPRPFCTQMVTVGSTEKSWVGRGTDQDSRHELKEGPLTGLNWAERGEWTEIKVTGKVGQSQTVNPRQEAPLLKVLPRQWPRLWPPAFLALCTSQLTSNPLEWVHMGQKPQSPGPLPWGRWVEGLLDGLGRTPPCPGLCGLRLCDQVLISRCSPEGRSWKINTNQGSFLGSWNYLSGILEQVQGYFGPAITVCRGGSIASSHKAAA